MSASRLPISAANDRQEFINYKAVAFLNDQAVSSMMLEVKRARALWDPSLAVPGTDRRGGWRCPPNTRYGGQITDRFGRNCGWGLTRRLANAITDIGERLEDRDEDRKRRRLDRRNRRVLRRIGGNDEKPGLIERMAGRIAGRLEQRDRTSEPEVIGPDPDVPSLRPVGPLGPPPRRRRVPDLAPPPRRQREVPSVPDTIPEESIDDVAEAAPERPGLRSDELNTVDRRKLEDLRRAFAKILEIEKRVNAERDAERTDDNDVNTPDVDERSAKLSELKDEIESVIQEAESSLAENGGYGEATLERIRNAEEELARLESAAEAGEYGFSGAADQRFLDRIANDDREAWLALGVSGRGAAQAQNTMKALLEDFHNGNIALFERRMRRIQNRKPKNALGQTIENPANDDDRREIEDLEILKKEFDRIDKFLRPQMMDVDQIKKDMQQTAISDDVVNQRERIDEALDNRPVQNWEAIDDLFMELFEELEQLRRADGLDEASPSNNMAEEERRAIAEKRAEIEMALDYLYDELYTPRALEDGLDQEAADLADVLEGEDLAEAYRSLAGYLEEQAEQIEYLKRRLRENIPGDEDDERRRVIDEAIAEQQRVLRRQADFMVGAADNASAAGRRDSWDSWDGGDSGDRADLSEAQRNAGRLEIPDEDRIPAINNPDGRVEPHENQAQPIRDVEAGLVRKDTNGVQVFEQVPVGNKGINTVEEAIDYVANGGLLSDVPDEFLPTAIFRNTDTEAGPDARFVNITRDARNGVTAHFRVFDRTTGARLGVKMADGWGFGPNEAYGEFIGNRVLDQLGFRQGGIRFGGVPGDDSLNPLRKGRHAKHPQNVVVYEMAQNAIGENLVDSDMLRQSDLAIEELIRGMAANFIIANEDRHGGNFMYVEQDGKFHLVLYDQGLGFGKWGWRANKMEDTLAAWLSERDAFGYRGAIQWKHSAQGMSRDEVARALSEAQELVRAMDLEGIAERADGFGLAGAEEREKLRGTDYLANTEKMFARRDAFLALTVDDLLGPDPQAPAAPDTPEPARSVGTNNPQDLRGNSIADEDAASALGRLLEEENPEVERLRKLDFARFVMDKNVRDWQDMVPDRGEAQQIALEAGRLRRAFEANDPEDVQRVIDGLPQWQGTAGEQLAEAARAVQQELLTSEDVDEIFADNSDWAEAQKKLTEVAKNIRLEDVADRLDELENIWENYIQNAANRDIDTWRLLDAMAKAQKKHFVDQVRAFRAGEDARKELIDDLRNRIEVIQLDKNNVRAFRAMEILIDDIDGQRQGLQRFNEMQQEVDLPPLDPQDDLLGLEKNLMQVRRLAFEARDRIEYRRMDGGDGDASAAARELQQIREIEIENRRREILRGRPAPGRTEDPVPAINNPAKRIEPGLEQAPAARQLDAGLAKVDDTGVPVFERVPRGNKNMNTVDDAVKHVAEGGLLADVPDDFLAMAILQNSDLAESPVPNPRFVDITMEAGNGINAHFRVIDSVTGARIGVKMANGMGFGENEAFAEFVGNRVLDQLGFRQGALRFGPVGQDAVDLLPVQESGRHPQNIIIYEMAHNVVGDGILFGADLELDRDNFSAQDLVRAMAANFLIGNEDRHESNWGYVMVDGRPRLVLWDQGLGFGKWGNEAFQVDPTFEFWAGSQDLFEYPAMLELAVLGGKMKREDVEKALREAQDLVRQIDLEGIKDMADDMDLAGREAREALKGTRWVGNPYLMFERKKAFLELTVDDIIGRQMN